MTDRKNWPLYSAEPSSSCSRRRFLATTGSLAAAALWAPRAEGALRRDFAFLDYPFTLGVASGDPTPDGVVLWTRLAPQPLFDGGMPRLPLEVSWQVAEDEGFKKVVRSGTTTATPEWAHSVHVEVDGLAPGRWYFYQFESCGEVSPTGRTRTLPAADAVAPALRFAFASCQHFEQGYFTAYEHMLKEDLDLVVHLGDYIYESGGRDGKSRKHVGGELSSLRDYRNRYAQYRGDPDLQAMHAAAPWIVTWDDHEVANNYAGTYSERDDVDPADFLKQRARAYKAYYEHMPLRRSSLPHGPDMPLYRRIAYGQLADFYVLDTRQYRTDQPCGDNFKHPCPESYDPEATILGESQRKWLTGGLSASTARWNVLAQQVLMARADFEAGPEELIYMDQWPGYEFERRQILKFLGEGRVANPVVLTGDNHANWANDLLTNFDNLEPKTVAVELVGTSISSGGDGSNVPKESETVLAENPYVKFYNAERGYVRCMVTPREWRADYQVVEYVTRKGAPLLTRASFVIEDGKLGLVKA